VVTPTDRASAWALPERLGGMLLAVARLTWIGVALALAIVAGVGFARAFADPELVATPPLTDLFVVLGLEFRFMIAMSLVAPLVVGVCTSWIVFWRRSRDPMALLFTICLLLLLTYSSRSLLTFEDHPVLQHATSIVFAGAIVCLALILALFPDGRFVPGTIRWLPVGAVALVIAFPNGGDLLMRVIDGEVDGGRTPILVVGFSSLLLVGMLAQIHRFRRVSTTAQRQQTKWVMVPLGGLFVLFVVALGLPVAFPTAGIRWMGWVLLAVIPVGVLFPVLVANAVLRYRLYDIDRLVSRTISYALVVAVLVGAYASLVVTLRGLLPIEGDVPVAISTLAVAMLFLPLARRVRLIVDRIFFRSHYDAAIVVSRFADELTHRLDPDELTGRTLDIVQRTFQPRRLDVWLAPDDR
jgi:hypothetical protein